MDSDSVLKVLPSGKVALLVAPQSMRKLSWGVKGGDEAERTKAGETRKEKRRTRRKAIGVENGDGKEDRKRFGFCLVGFFSISIPPGREGGLSTKELANVLEKGV